MMHPPLTSVPTLLEVFGPGVVYVPRRSPTVPGYSPPLPGQIDFLTGLQLGIAGGMPYVASAATVTPPALELRAEAGLPANAELHTYRSVPEYRALVARLIERGYRLANQRVHPESEVPSSVAYPAPELLRGLNDKGRLGDLVGAEWLPVRRVIPVVDLPESARLLAEQTPVVLKAATEKPSGGGHGVWICRTSAEVDAARTALAGEERVVIEGFLEIDVTVCLHGVVYPDGSTEMIGAAEEIVRNGHWSGNWHDAPGDNVPEPVRAAVCDIITNAAAAGYRGIVGIDVARLHDGTWRIIDLNFRVNGSTAGVWLRASVEANRGTRVMQGRGWACRAGFEALVTVVRAAVRRGTLLPFGLYDPEECDAGGLPRVSGLVLGESREAIDEEIRRLAGEGLT